MVNFKGKHFVKDIILMAVRWYVSCSLSYRDIEELMLEGSWKYYYRAVDKEGNTVDFMLSEKRDEAAARAFFTKAMNSSGMPHKRHWLELNYIVC